MQATEQVFKPIQKHQIRDIAVEWHEDEGRMKVITVVRPKNFWEQHELLSATVRLFFSLLPTIGLAIGLWQHDIAAIIGAIVLRIIWALVFNPRLGGARTEIEMKHVE